MQDVKMTDPVAVDDKKLSGDEIANVNFLYDDIVYTHYKIQ